MMAAFKNLGVQKWGHAPACHVMAVFVICLCCIAIYSNTLHAPFVYDDTYIIEANPSLRITQLGFWELYHAGFKGPCASRPVAGITFALNYYIGGYDVRGYHLVNIIIHMVNGLLVYLFALTIFRQSALSPPEQPDRLNGPMSDVQGPKSKVQSPGRALIPLMSLFAALIFIAHPLQTQSVTYIVQRMTSIAVMFYLLSLLLYIRGRVTRAGWKRWALFSGCFFSWILAMGSKQIAATLPFIIVLYEWYFMQGLSIYWLKRNIKYLVALVPLFVALVFVFLGRDPLHEILATYGQFDFSIWERVLTQFRVAVLYMSLLLYPAPSRLNLYHHFTTSHSLLDPLTTLLSLLVIVGLIVVAVHLTKKQRLISFCIFWFFINLIIESSIVGLHMIFEHRLYLPMVAFALVVSYLTFHFLSRRGSWPVLVSAFIIMALGTASYLRNGVWQDPVTLWSDVLSKNPKSHEAQNNLGHSLYLRGNLKEAIAHYSEAVSLKPGYAEAHNNLGLALDAQGKLVEAIGHYSEAVRLRPDYPNVHNNLGAALEAQGRIDEAVYHYSEALRIDPRYAKAHNNLGAVLYGQGIVEEAVGHFSEAIRIKPGYAEAYNNLGAVLLSQGKYKEASGNLSEALRLKPKYVEAHYNLGVALLGQREFREAIGHLSSALRLKPDNTEIANSLGVALAQGGRLGEAIRHFRHVLRIDPGHEEGRRNLESALNLLEKYRERHPGRVR